MVLGGRRACHRGRSGASGSSAGGEGIRVPAGQNDVNALKVPFGSTGVLTETIDGRSRSEAWWWAARSSAITFAVRCAAERKGVQHERTGGGQLGMAAEGLRAVRWSQVELVGVDLPRKPDTLEVRIRRWQPNPVRRAEPWIPQWLRQS